MAALSHLQEGVIKQLAKLGNIKKLEQSNLDLVRLLAAKTAQCETLKQRLDKRRESINSSPATQAKRSHVTPIKDIFLLSSSIIRDIEAAKNKDIDITSTFGGSILDITEECQATRNSKKSVWLLVGTTARLK